MGLQILIDGAKRLQTDPKKKGPLSVIGWGASAANYICLDDFLRLIAKNSAAIQQFRALLFTLVTTAKATLAGLQLIISQLETINAVLNLFVQNVRGTISAIGGSAGAFPFSSFANCPAVQAIKEKLLSKNKGLIPNDPEKFIPGNAGKLAKKYKQTTSSIKELEFRLLRNSQRIRDLKKQTETIRVWVEAWTVLISAIDSQFIN